ncbi:MAG TPA: hypothetical protein VLK33_12995, partial [Terriglobales bacterium]|nr:hypothetical protein [Terriglobales bacterium]
MALNTQGFRQLKFDRHERKLAALLVLFAIILMFVAPKFFAAANLSLLARSMGVLLIVATGMLNVILTGG